MAAAAAAFLLALLGLVLALGVKAAAICIPFIAPVERFVLAGGKKVDLIPVQHYNGE